MYCIVAERARLNGMNITGIGADNTETLLYQDSSNITNCGDNDYMYIEIGTSVCSDIITISKITSDRLVRYIQISTTNYLHLCEVEVCAGERTDSKFI